MGQNVNAQQPYAPVAETQVTDAPEYQSLGNMPSAENFADDKDVMSYCQSELYGIITRIKSRRKPLEDEWLSIQRLLTLTHDGGQKYKGRSNVYMPTFATAHATLVSQLSRALFPSDDFMDVEAMDFEADEQAEQVKMAIRYELDCNARVRQHLKIALSQFVSLGNMVIKYWYRTGNEFKGKKGKNGSAGFTARPQKGLTISARSVHNVVVYPETAEDEKDILITAEFMEIDRNYALALAKSSRWLNVESALAQSNQADLNQYARDQTVLDVEKIQGMTENVDYGDDRKPTAQIVTCIECYCNMRLPKSAYVEGEDSSLPVPARVVMFKGIPVSVTRNQNYDQEHPYLWARVGVVPGSFYGSWAGRRGRYLQYLINDFANQTNDTGIYGLNPVVLTDTNLLSGPLLPIAPGRQWRVRDVKNAVQFMHPPMEPIQYGQNLLGMYISALMDNTGAPPVLQGQKSADTATASSILQRNALSPLQDVVEDIESQMMIPLLERSWRLIVQFSDRPVMVKMPDGQLKKVTVADLDEYNYRFRFLASSQATNQQARAQQMLQMLQLLPAQVPLLMQNGYQVNPAPVLQRLWSDGFGMRQFDQFIFRMQQMPGMPGMQPGMSGAPPQEPGVNEALPEMRGAEQNAPVPQDPNAEPQATDEFNVTRTITDELNAMEGGKGLG